MRRNQLVWIIAVGLLAAMAAMGAEEKWPAFYPPGTESRTPMPWPSASPATTLPCTPGAWCSQEPPAGPAFTTDGDPESQAALLEIREVLMRRGCQVAVVERINEDGTRTPKLQVERVSYFIAMPDRKR